MRSTATTKTESKLSEWLLRTTMGSLIELTPEQRASLAALAEMKDEDIDYSGIPAPKYPVNPRTPEQWERYIQARHKKLRELYGPII